RAGRARLAAPAGGGGAEGQGPADDRGDPGRGLLPRAPAQPELRRASAAAARLGEALAAAVSPSPLPSPAGGEGGVDRLATTLAERAAPRSASVAAKQDGGRGVRGHSRPARAFSSRQIAARQYLRKRASGAPASCPIGKRDLASWCPLLWGEGEDS